jgi:hypothetical protein
MIIAFWIVAGLSALLYLGAGATKVVRPKPALQAAGMGWTENVPEPAVKLLGLAEVLGAVGLLLPVLLDIAPILSPVAGACLTVLMVGAIVVHRQRRESSNAQVMFAALTAAATVLAVFVVV